jgi:hypothetical protein
LAKYAIESQDAPVYGGILKTPSPGHASAPKPQHIALSPRLVGGGIRKVNKSQTTNGNRNKTNKNHSYVPTIKSSKIQKIET